MEFTHSVEPREPSLKRPNTVVLKCFSKILKEAGVEVDSKCNTVVDKYLSDTLSQEKCIKVVGRKPSSL